MAEDTTPVYDTSPPKTETTEAPAKAVKASKPKTADLGVQVPSLGRIVTYNHQEGDEINPLAAMITNVSKVADGILVVNLCVFDAFGGTFGVQGIKQGDEGSQWNWPVRVGG